MWFSRLRLLRRASVDIPMRKSIGLQKAWFDRLLPACRRLVVLFCGLGRSGERCGKKSV